ncbi:MAG: hypothetical protein Q4615_04025 [Paracoccus aminovorans]|nr:hypothetical protein [Paracoccus aminovorans]
MAEKFNSIKEAAEIFPHGDRVVLLESDGGSVAEALRISSIIDSGSYHTIIPNETRCASSCASLIFLAGKHRTIEENGLLGQHSCSSQGARNEKCNEIIAEHALTHGVSRGSVEAFVTYVEPSDIVWFSREQADGYGLTRYPGSELSAYETSEPIVLEHITGEIPKAQSQWRLDISGDGYRAFLRPVSDHLREMEVSFYCSSALPDKLILQMDITGPSDIISEAGSSFLITDGIRSWSTDQPSISQIADEITGIRMTLSKEDFSTLITSAADIQISMSFLPPFVDMVATTNFRTSQNVMAFMTNHCLDRPYNRLGEPI